MKEKLRALTLDQFQNAQITKTGTFKVTYGKPERELELEEAMIFGKIISGLHTANGRILIFNFQLFPISK